MDEETPKTHAGVMDVLVEEIGVLEEVKVAISSTKAKEKDEMTDLFLQLMSTKQGMMAKYTKV